MLDIRATGQLMKDLKAARKRGFNVDELNEIVRLIAEQQLLLTKNKDHKLSGKYAGCRECHIHPDWLLIYAVNDSVNILNLIRTGTHSDLF